LHTHFIALHLVVTQSPPSMQPWSILHPGQSEPPQSVSVSFPFFFPSKQPAPPLPPADHPPPPSPPPPALPELAVVLVPVRARSLAPGRAGGGAGPAAALAGAPRVRRPRPAPVGDGRPRGRMPGPHPGGRAWGGPRETRLGRPRLSCARAPSESSEELETRAV